MSETEKIILYVVGGYLLLTLLKGGSNSALQIAQTNALQNVGIANAASGAIASIAGIFN